MPSRSGYEPVLPALRCSELAGRLGVVVMAAGPQGYKLEEMTPQMVHYGNMPQHVMDRENESLRLLMERNGETSAGDGGELQQLQYGTHYSHAHIHATPVHTYHPHSYRLSWWLVVSGGALANMWRVCENAMKQYRRTRPDPSRNAIHRAKQLNLEHVHPLLLGTSPDTQGRWVGREGGQRSNERRRLQVRGHVLLDWMALTPPSRLSGGGGVRRECGGPARQGRPGQAPAGLPARSDRARDQQGRRRQRRRAAGAAGCGRQEEEEEEPAAAHGGC